MRKMPADSFTIPPRKQDKEREWPQDPVCVVGIIGKSGVGSADKASLSNLTLEKLVFPVQYQSHNSVLRKLRNISSASALPDEEDRDVSFSGYYDAEQQILYLQLLSMHDATQLSKICQRVQRTLSQSAWHDAWRNQENKYCNALLFLFCTCHVIMVTHPTDQFDPTYVHMFESLANIRESVERSLTQYLEDSLDEAVCGLWLASGRCALPRLLFVLKQNRVQSMDSAASRDNSGNVDAAGRLSENWIQRQASRYGAASPSKRFQLFVEDQIYNLCKRCRTRLMTGENALFTLSPHKFLHVVTPNASASSASAASSSLDSMAILMQGLPNQLRRPQLRAAGRASHGHHTLESRLTSASGRPPSPSASGTSTSEQRHSPNFHSSRISSSATSAIHPVAGPSKVSERASDETQSLQGFLMRHVEAIHQGADTMVFDKLAVGKNDGVLPNCDDWFAVASVIYDFFLGADGIGDQYEKERVRMPLQLQHQFSESRCSKAAPAAFNAYKEGLPDLYTTSQHKVQLDNALRVFSVQSRGPSMHVYIDEIRQRCEEYWEDGHKACEQISMTGRTCHLPYHLLPKTSDNGGSEESDGTDTPRVQHSNNHVALHSCNCGRLQTDRPDPFTLKDANFTFYETLELGCCGQLARAVFASAPPVYANPVGSFDYPTLFTDVASTQASQSASLHAAGQSYRHLSLPTLQQRADESVSAAAAALYTGRTSPTSAALDTAAEPEQEPGTSGTAAEPEQEPEQEPGTSRAAAVSVRRESLIKRRSELMLKHEALDLASGSTGSSGEEPADTTADPSSAAAAATAQPSPSTKDSCDTASPAAEDQDPSSVTSPKSTDNAGPAAEDQDPSSVTSPKSTNNAGPAAADSGEGEEAAGMEIADDAAAAEWSLYSDALAANMAGSDTGLQNDGVQDYEDQEEYEDNETLRPNMTALSADVSVETGDVDGNVMVHSASPLDLVPTFPSWSVVSLGIASQYNSATGLPQPGFLQGSNFLLAWDIPLNATHAGPLCLSGANAWTALAQCMQKGRPIRPTKSLKDTGVSTRLFVGMEYECFYGNRFLAAGPNKASKIHPTGHLKDSASRVLATPMPLYMGCPCRSAGKAHMAQLMRFFITTPADDIQVILHPHVQPAPSPCPVFNSGMPAGVALPRNSFCVLRFPFIYADDTGAILPPSDHSRSVRACYLLEGLIELRSLPDHWQ